jgi:polar amino acid transport system substrate-binding protein
MVLSSGFPGDGQARTRPCIGGSVTRRVTRRRVLASVLATTAVAGCARSARRPGEMIVGSSPTGVPFSFVDPWTNELAGSMIDAARAVIQGMDLEPRFQAVPFAALIPSLTVGRIDMIAAAMLRTPEREQVAAFSEPVLPYPAGLVVRSGDRNRYPDLSALRQQRVGVQVGTRFVEQLQAAGITRILTYDGLADILREIHFGRIDAGYGDEPILRYQLRVGPRRDARLVEEFRAPTLEYLCFVLRRGDPVIPRLNAEIRRERTSLARDIASRWHLEGGT